MPVRPLGKIGIDGNAPTLPNGCLAPQMKNPDLFAHTQAYFVRVNFILRPWNHPGDATEHCGRSWFDTFDNIVNGLIEKGLAVYGLIGAESTPKPDMGDALREPQPNPAAEEWLRSYVDCFKAIVEHFHDRVWAFESFNEPNDWHGGTKEWVHPYWMARILKELYLAVKPRFGDVRLISGPLLAHDLPTGPNDATRYLDAVYRYGIQHHGWEEVKQELGTYPLDGIGYHLYVCERAESTPEDVRKTYKKYLDAVWRVVTKYEGKNTTKRVYLSEFGWTSDHGEDFQARMMRAGIECVLNEPRIAYASWFCLQDFPGKNYGLYTAEGLAPANRKVRPYWVFRSLLTKVPIEGVPAGVGRDKDGTLYRPIVECYLRHGGEAAIGLPFDNGGGVEVHRWGNGWVQDFRTASGRRESIIMLREGEKTAHLLYGPIRHEYIYRQGGPMGPLGYPVTDLYTDDFGLPGCRFEGGEISCRPVVKLR